MLSAFENKKITVKTDLHSNFILAYARVKLCFFYLINSKWDFDIKNFYLYEYSYNSAGSLNVQLVEKITST